MPEQQSPPKANPGEHPTPQELEEILGALEFFLHMDEIGALPLEEAEDRDDGEER